MIKQFSFIVVSVLLLLASSGASAFELGVEFSADAIQVSPGQSPLISRMYVSKSAVRIESNKQGYRVVDIAYPEKGKRLLLYPGQKTYIEQTGLAVSPSWSGKKSNTPCDGMKNVRCKNMGEEKIDKIKVDKWQVEHTANGKTLRSLHWLDSKRRFAIKEMFPDGGMRELKLIGKDKLSDRSVEKWMSRYSHPSGRSRLSTQWYDPQLKMVIKEELPGGFFRELTNIKVSRQNKNLFKLPKGYRKLDGKTNALNARNQPGRQ